MQNQLRFNPYDYLDVVIPGAVFLGSLALALWPDWVQHEAASLSVAAGLVFLLLAYGVGHIMQLIGNLLEAFWWSLQGGMPMDWLRTRRSTLLPEEQVAELERHLVTKLGLPADFAIARQTGAAWYFVCRQAVALVAGSRQPHRLDYLQGTYSLNRGLAAALLSACVLVSIQAAGHMDSGEITMAALAGLALLFGVLALYRMQRFGVQYALDVFAQLVLLPEAPQEASVPQRV